MSRIICVITVESWERRYLYASARNRKRCSNLGKENELVGRLIGSTTFLPLGLNLQKRDKEHSEAASTETSSNTPLRL